MKRKFGKGLLIFAAAAVMGSTAGTALIPQRALAQEAGATSGAGGATQTGSGEQGQTGTTPITSTPQTGTGEQEIVQLTEGEIKITAREDNGIVSYEKVVVKLPKLEDGSGLKYQWGYDYPEDRGWKELDGNVIEVIDVGEKFRVRKVKDNVGTEDSTIEGTKAEAYPQDLSFVKFRVEGANSVKISGNTTGMYVTTNANPVKVDLNEDGGRVTVSSEFFVGTEGQAGQQSFKVTVGYSGKESDQRFARTIEVFKAARYGEQGRPAKTNAKYDEYTAMIQIRDGKIVRIPDRGRFEYKADDNSINEWTSIDLLAVDAGGVELLPAGKAQYLFRKVAGADELESDIIAKYNDKVYSNPGGGTTAPSGGSSSGGSTVPSGGTSSGGMTPAPSGGSTVVAVGGGSAVTTGTEKKEAEKKEDGAAKEQSESAAAVVGEVSKKGEISASLKFSSEVKEIKVEDKAGNSYSVKIEADEIKTGDKFKVFEVKDGKYLLVNGNTYIAAENGLAVSLKSGADYVLLSEESAKAQAEKITETVKLSKESLTLTAGKSRKIKFDTALDMGNVKKVSYVYNKNKVSISKVGVVTAKSGKSATVKVKVVLKNGQTKTLKLKVVMK